MFKRKCFIFEDKRYGIVEYDKFIEEPQVATYHIASLISSMHVLYHI